MTGGQPREELDHGGGHRASRLEQVRNEPFRLEHFHHPGIVGEAIHVESVAHRRSEQEVLTHRRVVVVAFGVEALDESGDGGIAKPLPERASGPEETLAKVALGVDGAAETEVEDVAIELDHPEHLEGALRGIVAEGIVVDPVAVHVVRRVARNRRFRRPVRVRMGAGSRLVLQPVQEVVAHRRVEHERLRADVGEPAAGHPLVHPVRPFTADGERARSGIHEPGEDEGELLPAAAGSTDQRDPGVRRDADRHAFEKAGPGIVTEGEAGSRDLALHPGAGRRRPELERLVEHPGGTELGDDLLVLDTGVFAALVVVEQLLPGRGEVLVGRDRGHQGANLEPPHDHEVAADGVEAERSEVVDRVVEELDHELPDEDLQAHHVDVAEAGRHGGTLVGGGVVSTDLLDPGHRLPDAVREPAYEPNPLLGEGVHPALELRDDIELERIEGDRGRRHHPVLNEEEREDHEQVATLEDRELERVADEPSERLHLGGDSS